jgi:polyphosphate kinase
MTAACPSRAVPAAIQYRVEQALDESYPLLERLKFLLIFSSSLDGCFEFGSLA